MLVVLSENVATPEPLIVTGGLCATLSSRNCTVPVGTAPPVEELVVEVKLMFVPCTTAVGVPVSVVFDTHGVVAGGVVGGLVVSEHGPVPATSGVTRLQSVTRLNTSTEPHPLARSLPTPAEYPIVPPAGQLTVPAVH